MPNSAKRAYDKQKAKREKLEKNKKAALLAALHKKQREAKLKKKDA